MADIPINEVTRRVQFTGNTTVGPFAFTFNILDDDDLVVYKNFVLQTITTDYTVSTNANGTGSITMTTALVASDVLTIIGGRALERTTDFVTAGDLLASSLNEQLDSLVIMAQQLDEKLDRSVKVDIGDQFTDLSLPAKADRLGTVLAFNATSGDPEAGPEIGDVSSIAAITADIATLADIEDGTDATDAIQTVAGISSNVSTVSGISANVTTVAGISSDVTAVAGDATDIGTVATNISDVNTAADNITDIQNASTNAATATTKASEAATSATNAATSATNAATSATNAATSETNASTSATSAATSATSASNAQTAAEAARDSALASFDSFDDRYLGSKSSDPTLDNDGNALVAGALYFNTAQTAMKVYSGSAWVAAYVSGTDYLALTGGTLTGNLDFGDNNKARFGDGDDFEIYHNGTHNYIEAGSGSSSDLIITSTDDVIIGHGTAASYETMAQFANDGSVSLMYNGSSKIYTQSTGVGVNGDLTASDDVFVNGGALQVSTSSTNGANIQLRSTDTVTSGTQQYGTIDFYSADTSGGGPGIKSSIAAHASGQGGAASFLSFSNASSTVLDIESVRMYDAATFFYNGHTLYVYDDDTTNYFAITPPSNITTSYTLTMPASGPAADQILVSDASGNLSFEDKPTAGGTAFSAF